MDSLSLFDFLKAPLKIDKPIRLIELFAGIGSQAKALKRLGADFEHYRVCEFNKYAIRSYNAIHGTDFVTSDVTKITADDLGIVDTDKYCYILTYSFPCQDLSLAGKGKGMAKDSGTRSGLLWEVERLLNECGELPRILLMENVTQVHGKKNKAHFDKWIEFLVSKGYSNYWEDLNAKNFGIPQNRNRTFMVSVLGEYIYHFPKGFPLKLRLKDFLEDMVDERFYLGDKFVKENHVTVTAFDEPLAYDEQNRYIRKDGTVGTLTTDGSSPKHNNRVIEPQIKRVGKINSSQDGVVVCSSGIAPTHTAGHGNTPKVMEGSRVRKLTPKECWRVMGFDDIDFEKAGTVNSNTQLYKQAGNSIVVNVLEEIFRQMM